MKAKIHIPDLLKQQKTLDLLKIKKRHKSTSRNPTSGETSHRKGKILFQEGKVEKTEISFNLVDKKRIDQRKKSVFLPSLKIVPPKEYEDASER